MATNATQENVSTGLKMKPPKPGEDWQWYGDDATGGWAPSNHPLVSSQPSGGSAGDTTVPGTTAGGIKPPSALPSAPGVSVTGGAGTSSLTPSPDGSLTGVAPSLGLGRTTGSQVDTLAREQLMKMLTQNPNDIRVTDADLAPQADAYAAARERARRQQQAASATSLAGAGLGSSGAADTARNQGFETAGQDVAAFNAGLVGDKVRERQQTLQQAVQTATALGMQEEAQNLQRQLANLNAQMSTMSLGQGQQGQQLQRELANLDTASKTYLANLDADLRRQGYSTSERLATMDTELRRYGIDVQGNLGLLNAMIQMIGQGQQNQQFYDTLGFDMGKFQTLVNTGLINSLI